jgi:DNA-binding NtrC family response regulator
MSPSSPPPSPPITAAAASRDRVYLDSLASSLARAGIELRSLIPGSVGPPTSLVGVDVLIVDSDSLTERDLAWLDWLRDQQPLVEVLAVTGDSPVADAVKALRAGAFTVLQHPVSDDRLVEALMAAGRRHRHARARLEALNGAGGGRSSVRANRPFDDDTRPRKDGR